MSRANLSEESVFNLHLLVGVPKGLHPLSLTSLLIACEKAGSGRIGKVDMETLKPGLAVRYYPQFWGRHLDTLFSSELAVESGEPGEPIPYLNHDFGRDIIQGKTGEIFITGYSKSFDFLSKILYKIIRKTDDTTPLSPLLMQTSIPC